MEKDNSPTRSSSSYPRLKVLYLISVTLGVFLCPPILRSVWPQATGATFVIIAAVLAVQAGLLLANEVSVSGIVGACSRLKWLFVFLVLCATLLRNLNEGRKLPLNPVGTAISGVQMVEKKANVAQRGDRDVAKSTKRNRAQRDAWRVVNFPTAPQWRLNLNLTGFQASVLMCLQIATVLLVSAFVRVSGSGTDLVDGLRGLKFPQLFCYSIDNTLALIGGVKPRPVGGRKRKGSGQGTGKGGGRAGQGATPASDDPGFWSTLGKLMRGDLAFFLDAIRAGQERSKRRIQETMGSAIDARLAHDAAILSGIGVMLMSMKMLKVLPGISFASGYKTLLYIPLYLLASRLTYSRWGGTTAGSIMGVIGLMMGDGKTGVFEVLKHIAPGVVVDLLDPVIVRLPPRKIVYACLGLTASVARTLADLALVLIPALSAGNFRENPEVLLFPFVKLIPNIFFGTIGGIVAYYVIRAFERKPSEMAPEHPENFPSEDQLLAVVRDSPGQEDGKENASATHAQR